MMDEKDSSKYFEIGELTERKQPTLLGDHYLECLKAKKPHYCFCLDE